jgi:hypothetical protein
MNWLHSIFVLAAAFLAVFCAAAFQGLRHLLGAQLDLLPALMVYAALSSNLVTVCLLGLCGGVWFDALSANPLGVSVLPLFAAGLVVYHGRELVLRNQTFAQFVIGLAASATVPVLTLLMLLTTGHKPLLGWGTLWQWIVVSAGGAVATPAFFMLFEWADRALIHSRQVETSFRPDREIRRGRN